MDKLFQLDKLIASSIKCKWYCRGTPHVGTNVNFSRLFGVTLLALISDSTNFLGSKAVVAIACLEVKINCSFSIGWWNDVGASTVYRLFASVTGVNIPVVSEFFILANRDKYLEWPEAALAIPALTRPLIIIAIIVNSNPAMLMFVLGLWSKPKEAGRWLIAENFHWWRHPLRGGQEDWLDCLSATVAIALWNESNLGEWLDQTW